MSTFIPSDVWQTTTTAEASDLINSSFSDPFRDSYLTSMPQTPTPTVFSPPQHISHQMVSPISAQPHSSTELGYQSYGLSRVMSSHSNTTDTTEYAAPESSSDRVDVIGRKKGSKKTDKDKSPCLVCGDVSSGIHYGRRTCEGCKGFFRRTIEKKKVSECKHRPLGSCNLIGQDERNKCAFCRLMKCFVIGMSRNCSKLGRARKDSTEDGGNHNNLNLSLTDFYARMEEEHSLFQSHKMNRITKKRTKSESSFESRPNSNETSLSGLPERYLQSPAHFSNTEIGSHDSRTVKVPHLEKPNESMMKVNHWLNNVPKTEPPCPQKFNWEADLAQIQVQPLDVEEDKTIYYQKCEPNQPRTAALMASYPIKRETSQPLDCPKYGGLPMREASYPTRTTSPPESFFSNLAQNNSEPQNFRPYLNLYKTSPFSEPVAFDSNGIHPNFDKKSQWFHQWFQTSPEQSNASVETNSFVEFLTIENAIMDEQELPFSKHESYATGFQYDYQHCLPPDLTGINTTSQIELIEILMNQSSLDCVQQRGDLLTDDEAARVREISYDNFRNYGPSWKSLMGALINLGLTKLYILFSRTDRATRVNHRYSNLLCPISLFRTKFRDLASRESLFSLYEEYKPHQNRHVSTQEMYNRVYNRLITQIDFIVQFLSKKFLSSHVEKANLENKSTFISIIRRIIYLEKLLLLSIDMSSDIERQRIPTELRVRNLLKPFLPDITEQFGFQSTPLHVGNVLFDRKFVDILQKMQYCAILFPVRAYMKCPAAFLLKAEGALHICVLMFAYRMRCLQRTKGNCFDIEQHLFLDDSWNNFIGKPLAMIVIGISRILDTIVSNTDLFLFTFLICGSLPAHLHFPDTEINRRVMMCIVDFYEDYMCYANIEAAFIDFRKVFAVRALTELAYPYLCELIAKQSDVLDPIFYSIFKTISCPQKVLGEIPAQQRLIFNPMFANNFIMSGLNKINASSVALTRWDTVNTAVTPQGRQNVCVTRWGLSHPLNQEITNCCESGQYFHVRETPTTPPSFRQPLPIF